MWRQLNVGSVAVVGLLVGACSDNRAPTMDAPPTSTEGRAAMDAANGARSTPADFDAAVPIAYYQLSLDFTKQTGGFTPPVQARAYGYMGLALYEAVVSGIPDHRSVASQLNGVGPLPGARGAPYDWALVANASLAEVMRGLWGDKTNRAADNIAALNALETRLANQYSVGVPPGIAKLSIEFGRAVGAAVFATSRDDGGDEGYLTNFPASYTPPTGPGLASSIRPGRRCSRRRRSPSTCRRTRASRPP